MVLDVGQLHRPALGQSDAIVERPKHTSLSCPVIFVALLNAGEPDICFCASPWSASLLKQALWFLCCSWFWWP